MLWAQKFVTRDWGRDSSAVRHGALVCARCLAWPRSNKAISVLTAADMPCTWRGVFVIMQSQTRVGSDLSTAPREYQRDKCSVLACACKALLALVRDEGDFTPWGHQPVWDELHSLHGTEGKLPPPEMWAQFVHCFLLSLLCIYQGSRSWKPYIALKWEMSIARWALQKPI